MNLQFYNDWFERYTADTRRRIPADDRIVLDEFDLKIDHTLLVRDRCTEIAHWLCLPEEDIVVASLVGLFHDLGRFRQAERFGTMDDRVTGSHGAMSEDIFLTEAPHTGLPDESVGVIADALRCHNLYELPDGLSVRSFLFARLARDGDKLDIFRFYADKDEKRNFRFIMSEAEGDFKPELLEAVLRGENINYHFIRNKNDRLLLTVSLIYNLNFGYSCRWLLEQGYLEQLTGVADGTADDTRREVCAYALRWMRQRVGMGKP